MLYKENVTKEKLRKYLNQFDIIEIIPLKGNDPIFILKNRKAIDILVPSNKEVIIHRGNFIWANKEILKQRVVGDIDTLKYFPSGVLGEHGIIEIPTDEHPTYDDYPRRFIKKSYPSKQFSIKSIKDKKIPLSSTRYIQPIKKLFKKYGILIEKRGTKPKISDVGKERRQFVLQELKAISAGRRKDTSRAGIWNRWCDYVNKKYQDAENVDKLYFNYTTVWRDCQVFKNCIKK